MTRIASTDAAAALVAAPRGAARPGRHGHGRADGAWAGGGIDFAAIDTDGNGSLSRAELRRARTERLAAADANGDGALDRDEIVAAMPRPPAAARSTSSAPTPARRMADRLLAMMGATETGQVEVAALAERRVNMLLAFADTDRDAAISGRGRGDAGAPRRLARTAPRPSPRVRRRPGRAARGRSPRTAARMTAAAARFRPGGRAPRDAEETAARGRAIVARMSTGPDAEAEPPTPRCSRATRPATRRRRAR